MAIAKTHKLILTKKARTILKEDDYLSDMDKLITRDFFPHYDNLKDQHDYLKAEGQGDSEQMRAIALKYRKRAGERPTTGAWTVGGTPAAFELSPQREQKDDTNKVHLTTYLFSTRKIFNQYFGLLYIRYIY